MNSTERMHEIEHSEHALLGQPVGGGRGGRGGGGGLTRKSQLPPPPPRGDTTIGVTPGLCSTRRNPQLPPPQPPTHHGENTPVGHTSSSCTKRYTTPPQTAPPAHRGNNTHVNTKRWCGLGHYCPQCVVVLLVVVAVCHVLAHSCCLALSWSKRPTPPLGACKALVSPFLQLISWHLGGKVSFYCSSRDEAHVSRTIVFAYVS